jgi:preprotein translocase subunit YajC
MTGGLGECRVAVESSRTGNGTLVNDEALDLPVSEPSPQDHTKDNADMDLVVFLPLLIILGAFMYFASRRQKKAMQATIDLQNSLQIGDRVHTTSGLEGTITALTEDNVELEIAPGVVTTWMKLAVRDKVEDDFEEDTIDTDDGEVVESPNSKTDG